jgi:hypothetical protein
MCPGCVVGEITGHRRTASCSLSPCGTGGLQTRCWREVDSNLRSPSRIVADLNRWPGNRQTWSNCQIIIVSSTVPMPPGITTNATDISTNWCSRVKNVLCSYAWVTKAFTRYSNGSCTRMPTELVRALESARLVPSLAAAMRPGPPPVMMSHPIRVSSLETSRTAA